MKIKLDSMNIKNFKGLEHYNFVVNGENVTVKADNKKGKTSLTDAFHWVLFGKDAATSRSSVLDRPMPRAISSRD